MKTFRLGVLVNPFAGIGGALALKGSDGEEIRKQALAAGAKQEANDKMLKALKVFEDQSANVNIVTAGGEMGESVCRQAGLSVEVAYTATGQTEGEDTEAAASAIAERGVDLLLFAGGDGTARNISNVIGQRIPVLGVPAGCKIHSGVYAVTPSAAGEVVAKMIRGELLSELEGEVRDIDEEAFRNGKVLAKHFAEMRIPEELTYIQAVKMGGRESEALVLDDIAAYISEMMDDSPETCFVMGSGSTVANIMSGQGLANTLLGVDVVKNGEVIGADVTAKQLLALTENQAVKLVITAIGGQGHIFGRGNQQLSVPFLKRLGKEDIVLIATKEKLQSLAGRPLRLDTGDNELDASLAGRFTVITGYKDKVLYPAN